MTDRQLEGKVALVTGGNTGIGRAVAEAYAANGADVAVGWFERPDEARDVQGAIEAHGQRAFNAQVDVTAADSVAAFWSAVVAELGHVDILVNNAGIQSRKPLLEVSPDEFDRMLAVHLRGAFLNAQQAALHMRPRKAGRIINVCSQLGYIGRGEYVAYSTAKGGLIALTRALARELAPDGILVNGVSPGLVDTGFDPLSDDDKAAHAVSLPLARLGTPEDMTSAFVFLASDAGSYYCGQMLHPNGGEIMP